MLCSTLYKNLLYRNFLGHQICVKKIFQIKYDIGEVGKNCAAK